MSLPIFIAYIDYCKNRHKRPKYLRTATVEEKNIIIGNLKESMIYEK